MDKITYKVTVIHNGIKYEREEQNNHFENLHCHLRYIGIDIENEIRKNREDK